MAWIAGGSGSSLEQLGDGTRLDPHVPPAGIPNLCLPVHGHRLAARQCSSRHMETAEARPRSDQAFHAPVVLFHDVVEELALPQAGEAPQLAIPFQLLDGRRTGRVLVHRDGTRVDRMRLPQRLAEEALRGRRVPPGREQEVDRLAAAVDNLGQEPEILSQKNDREGQCGSTPIPFKARKPFPGRNSLPIFRMSPPGRLPSQPPLDGQKWRESPASFMTSEKSPTLIRPTSRPRRSQVVRGRTIPRPEQGRP